MAFRSSARPVETGTAVRTVTASQVTRATMQLRERPRQSAVEQVAAVLRAFDLAVVPDPTVPEPRG